MWNQLVSIDLDDLDPAQSRDVHYAMIDATTEEEIARHITGIYPRIKAGRGRRDPRNKAADGYDARGVLRCVAHLGQDVAELGTRSSPSDRASTDVAENSRCETRNGLGYVVEK